MVKVKLPMHTASPLELTGEKKKSSGLPKDSPVNVLVVPLALCDPPTFSHTTVVPGSMARSCGLK